MIKKKRYISEQYEKHHLIFKAKELNLHMFKCTQTFRQRITRNCFTLFSLGRNWASLVAQLAKNLPAGDPSSIPGSGISPGEEIGYPLQYSWASLGAQLVKNPPAMRETWVQSLGWEDSLENLHCVWNRIVLFEGRLRLVRNVYLKLYRSYQKKMFKV